MQKKMWTKNVMFLYNSSDSPEMHWYSDVLCAELLDLSISKEKVAVHLHSEIWVLHTQSELWCSEYAFRCFWMSSIFSLLTYPPGMSLSYPQLPLVFIPALPTKNITSSLRPSLNISCSRVTYSSIRLYSIRQKTPWGCAMDWMWGPQIHTMKPNAHCDGIWKCGLREVIRPWGWSFYKLVPFIRRDTRDFAPLSLLSANWGLRRRLILQTRKEVLTRYQICQYLDLEHVSFHNCEICLVFKSLNLWYISYSNLNLEKVGS